MNIYMQPIEYLTPDKLTLAVHIDEYLLNICIKPAERWPFNFFR